MRLLSDIRLLQGSFAALLCVVLTGTVALALALQYIGGFLPCELCLLERIPYYIGASLAALAFVAALCRCPPKWVAFLFIFIALLMFYDAALSVYHVGVELKYWPGPDGCSLAAAQAQQAGSLLDSLNDSARIIPCEVPAGYIFGISFAGWNALATFFFALCAVFAARFPLTRARRQHSA
ncbi:disulfide bond formation protein B [Candidatus Tokpelaia sp.]|uniref:disulfide bond formation protein B n=1 Tax=Candidatus Tokpelaia sp. TaxID=2233777 RepID=UPI001239678E|nr:disulfide bond formation protein B [Candidatus Tokpelaia sp.]KAA6405754.1 disulfide bond formation protein B [Candidatus Tokpelaia sp.]